MEHALLGALGGVTVVRVSTVPILGALVRLLDVRLDLAHPREHHVEPGAVLTKRRE